MLRQAQHDNPSYYKAISDGYLSVMNKNLPTFSIIVPVYNGQDVIGKCIESILAQSYQCYEVIIIDDGSVDQTQGICQHYCSVDNRIIYFKQNNKGVSSARNRGTKIARNDYVLFVDADDYLSSSYLNYFSELITESNSKSEIFIIQDFIAEIKFSEEKNETYKWCKFSEGEYTLSEVFEELKFMNWLNWGVPFAKIYSLPIIKKYNISFNEQMSFREDLIFMLDYIKHVDKIIFDSNAGYHYIIDNTKTSLSNTAASFSNEVIFFEYLKNMSDDYIDKFHLSKESALVLQKVTYNSFLRCVNSCMYKYKIPMRKVDRIDNLKSLSTKENMNRLSMSGVADSKARYFAFFLLKNKFYNAYDFLNKIRYGLS